MAVKDGGPAFPAFLDFNPCSGKYEQRNTDGMSLRDYFAAQLAAAFYAGDVWRAITDNTPVDADIPKMVALRAYEAADAMLKAREA